MLVLSRKDGESIEIPELGIVIQVTSIKKSRVTLGIEAPKELAILRGEIADGFAGSKDGIESKVNPKCFAIPSIPSTTVNETASDYALSNADQASLYQVA